MLTGKGASREECLEVKVVYLNDRNADKWRGDVKLCCGNLTTVRA